MRAPLLLAVAAFALGIALYARVAAAPRALFWFAVAALLAATAAWRRRWLGTAFLLLLGGYFWLGASLVRLDAVSVPGTRVDQRVARGQLDLAEPLRIEGWLRREPTRSGPFIVYLLELEAITSREVRHATSGGVRLSYFPAADARSLPALHYGDRVELLVRLQEPRNYQNPGSFDWRAYWARQGIYLVGALKHEDLLSVRAGWRGNPIFAGVLRLRERLLATLDEVLPGDAHLQARAVLRAMLLGDRAFLDHEVADTFRRTGTYHVLVISGLHVAMLAVAVLWLLRRLRVAEWLQAATAIFVLLVYLLLADDRPPIERAVWMVALFLLARLLFRRVALANTAALAGLVILLPRPQWLLDAGFQLSFAAVLLIALLAVPWVERTSQPYRQALAGLDNPERDDTFAPPQAQFRLDLRDLTERLGPLRKLLVPAVRAGLRAWDIVVVSFAIHLGFVLLLAIYFNRVTWTGLLANILIVPLSGILVPLGLGTLLVGSVWLAAGKLAGAALGELTHLLLWIVQCLGELNWLTWRIPVPPPWITLAYIVALAALAATIGRRWPRHRTLAGWHRLAWLPVLALLVVIVTHPFAPRLARGELEITALDVGQGDALFVALPNGETWLVDAGPGPLSSIQGYRVGSDAGENVVSPYLWSRSVKRLDRVLLTHAHHDHLGGLPAVFENFPVREFWVGNNRPSGAYRQIAEQASAKNVPPSAHGRHERHTFGAVEAHILSPRLDAPPDDSSPNNDSLVLRLSYGGRSVLLAGDIERRLETELLATGLPLAADVLKVPHHGSRSSTSGEFLARVAAPLAIISVGAQNPHGHPHPEVLARLRAAGARPDFVGARILRTDQDGATTVGTNGHTLRVSTFAEQRPPELYPSLWLRLRALLR